jgi:hypothetical protein
MKGNLSVHAQGLLKPAGISHSSQIKDQAGNTCHCFAACSSTPASTNAVKLLPAGSSFLHRGGSICQEPLSQPSSAQRKKQKFPRLNMINQRGKGIACRGL